MTPRVSILIPCHNAGKFVASAVESALAQTWRQVEIIVVNDSSTDDSLEILRTFEGRGVRVFSERFGNAAAARNCAYRHATGAYVKFFDADDLLAPQTIELQIARLAGSETAVASAEWGRFQGDDLSTFQPNPQSVWRDMNSLEWLVESWRDANPMMQPGLFLLPRALLEKSGGWDETLSLIDDFEFYARVLCQASEVRFADGARLYYRSGLAGSLSGRKSRRAVESACRSLLAGTAHLLARRQDKPARLACANLLQDFIYTYYPEHPDLRGQMSAKITELGGGNLPPTGPPRFKQLSKLLGWKLARRVQRWLARGK